MKKNLGLIILFLFAVLALAGKYLRSRPLDRRCIAVTDTKVLNFETAAFEDSAVLVMRDGRFAGRYAAFPESLKQDNCSVFEGRGFYVIPGLIDSHTHLLAGDLIKVTSWKEALEGAAGRAEMSRLLIGEKNALSMLRAGFTAWRDLGNSGIYLDKKLAELLGSKYEFAPLMIYSGPALAMPPSQVDLRKYPKEYEPINENSDFNSIVIKHKRQGATWIKIYADNSGPDVSMPLNVARQIIASAHRFGLKVSVHAEHALSAAIALEYQPDSIEHFYRAPQGAEPDAQLKKSAVVLTDHSLVSCKNWNFSPDCDKEVLLSRERTAWLKSRAYTLVFGSDAILDTTGRFQSRGAAALDSLLALSQLGFTGFEIVAMATKNAGEMLGLDVGQIKDNYRADLVMYKSDPLKDIEALKSPQTVFANGQIVCRTESECAP